MSDTLLEDRLREAFRAAAADMTDVLDEVDAAGSPDAAASRRPGVHRPRFATALAVAAVLLVGLIGVVAVIGSRHRALQRPADLPAAPSWYRVVTPLLPPGFDRVTASVNGDNVRFDALNDQGEWFTARVSRVPIPDDPSGADLPKTVDAGGTWFEQDGSFNLVTPAGIQAQAGCVDAECRGPDGPLSPAAVRGVVASLATIDPADLPTTSSARPDDTLLSSAATIVGSKLVGDELVADGVGDPDGAVRLSQWNPEPVMTTDTFTTVHVFAGLYPAPDRYVRAAFDRPDGGRTDVAVTPSGAALRISTSDRERRAAAGAAMDEVLASLVGLDPPTVAVDGWTRTADTDNRAGAGPSAVVFRSELAADSPWIEIAPYVEPPDAVAADVEDSVVTEVTVGAGAGRLYTSGSTQRATLVWTDAAGRSWIARAWNAAADDLLGVATQVGADGALPGDAAPLGLEVADAAMLAAMHGSRQYLYVRGDAALVTINVYPGGARTAAEGEPPGDDAHTVEVGGQAFVVWRVAGADGFRASAVRGFWTWTIDADGVPDEHDFVRILDAVDVA